MVFRVSDQDKTPPFNGPSSEPSTEPAADPSAAPTVEAPRSDAEQNPESISLDLDQEALNELTYAEDEHKTPKIKELLQSIDPPSRYMTALSIAFALLAAVCFSLLVGMYLKHRHHAKKPAPEKAPVEIIVTEPLGEFKMGLKSEKPDAPELEMRMDLVVECNTQEACDTVKSHIEEARDLVNPVLSTATQEEVMQLASKNLLRKKITDRLNSLPMKGKILQVDIANFTLERGK